MSFRFRIHTASKARPPVVVLVGALLEGEVHVGDTIVVPLLDGSQITRVVLGVLPGRPDDTATHVSAAEPHEWVGIAFERRGEHRADDIAHEIARDADGNRKPEPRQVSMKARFWMATIPHDAVIVSDTSFASDDPDELVQSNLAYVNALLDDHLTSDEIAPDALRSYYVDFFQTYAGFSSFEDFADAGGWHPLCVRAVREGLQAMGATQHLAMFEEASRRVGAGLSVELDEALTEVASQENLLDLHAAWLRALPNLVVLPIEQMRAEALRRASEVPADRLATIRAAEPRELRLIRALCAAAGQRFMHLYEDRFTDHARFVGVWHFITDQGHFQMIEQGGRALMQHGGATICSIVVPPDAS